jgi:PIN domain nuclease of toxin-antitoxin system
VSAIADSCAVVLFLRDPDAATRMPNAFPYMRSREVYVPPLVVLEIVRKTASGELPPLPTDLPRLLRQHDFVPLPMTWEVAALAASLPPIHRDPIDRALVAHAMEQKMPILTCNGIIPQYGVPTIW